jgi:hypothetical protein
VVVLAGKERLRFKFGDVAVRGGDLAVQILEQVIFLLGVGLFLGKMNIGLDIAREGSKFFVGSNLFFGALAIAEDTLR